ncbi:hypothetical protein WJX81_001632 [Elliptochloris bilobata]|uniref:BPL/LPL catalytic domain-containing protein n=1 Tax=Elliptochloris bilobata TaxID=381761 RepID=A0AAW1R2A8_9CHLO
MRPVVNLLRLRGVSILQQLRLEEALLRADPGNWCILNDGSATAAIVLGISGKSGELVHEEAAAAAGLPLIKRFSGGGTVVVDADTLFATIIMNAAALPDVECYPRPVMRWSELFYTPIFAPYGDFSLREHDYAFGERKFGGNAQAITKQRWLHHTSLLWDFRDVHMRLLKHPSKAPEYRAGRNHLEFVCRLRDYLPARELVFDGTAQALRTAGFAIKEVGLEEAGAALDRDYLRSTRVLEPG